MTDGALREAREWWRTELIEIEPGVINVRGYPIAELIGKVRFVDMIWLLLRGELPTHAQGRLLEAALVAAVDHGPQAPSIAIARMAITTGIGLNNAIASAVNVLGDVHGGAGQACLELLYEIDRRHSDGVLLDEAVSQVLAHERAAGRRFVPGFGHRFHPIDPRVAPLEELVREASREGAVDGRFVAIGRALESGVSERVKQTIPMNIDGITAVVFAELGFAAPLARGLFVLSRSVGILAHAWEQSQQESRLKGPIPPHFLYAYDGPAERHLERRA